MDRKNMRRRTRECALQYLYEAEVQKDFGNSSKEAFILRLHKLRDYENLNDQDTESPYKIEMGFFNKVMDSIILNLESIDNTLESSTDNWKIDRISKVDLAILRLAIGEIIYMDDIPESVSINEAVELAKVFGNDGSAKFVNGVLGKIVRDRSLGS